FAGKKSAQIREILISESAWEEMTCLFAPSLNDPPTKNITLNKITPCLRVLTAFMVSPRIAKPLTSHKVIIRQLTVK
ncbi:hypothetical protein M3B34_26515, partial [Klebsiella quasipneumoniae]|nr:hypothetical protein [Klebsiella quasipneumoniae]